MLGYWENVEIELWTIFWPQRSLFDENPLLGIVWVGLSYILLHFHINKVEDKFLLVKYIFIFVNEVENLVSLPRFDFSKILGAMIDIYYYYMMYCLINYVFIF